MQAHLMEPPTIPLYDTWGLTKYVGFWCITQPRERSGHSIQEANPWFIDMMQTSLRSFAALARAWRIRFRSVYHKGVGEETVVWQPGSTYQTFIDQAVQAIRGYPAPIYSMDIDLDLYVYVRTQEAETPHRVWARLPSQFQIWGGPEVPKGSVCFSVTHTLFSPAPGDGKDNCILHSLNQPLLEQALCQWEKEIGPIDEVEGIDGMFRYGFLPEENG